MQKDAESKKDKKAEIAESKNAKAEIAESTAPAPKAVHNVRAAMKVLKVSVMKRDRINYLLKTDDVTEIHKEHSISKWKEIFQKL